MKLISFTGIRYVLVLVLLFSGLASNCQKNSMIAGDLIIFHAGSLSVPFRQMAAEFKKQYPQVNFLTEASGSVASARKITDLHKPCDLIASADYAVIDKMLIPEYADWNLKFASNEMCIVFAPGSKYANQINSKNWTTLLLKNDVLFGRSDPNADPCGYRTEMLLQLAEKHYRKPGLYKQFISKDKEFMRPKETDLLALLESGSIDYIFLYRSVAVQHQLKYLILPDEINLKNQAFAKQYSQAKVEINGSKPGEKQVMTGEPMIYSFTIPRNAPNKAAAIAFAEFILNRSKGEAIMNRNGQPSVKHTTTTGYDKLPTQLKAYVKH